MGEWKDLNISSTDVDLNTRLTILEEQYELVEYYYTVTSGTTGTVTIPIGYTIETDRFPNGIDAIVAKEGTDGRPTDEAVYTNLGVIISTTLATNGNYVLSGIPSGYNVCIVYYLKGKRKYRDSLLLSNLIESSEYITNTHNKLVGLDYASSGHTGFQAALTNPVTGTGTTNKLTKFTGTSIIGNSNIEDTGTVVKIPVVANIGDGGTTNYSQFEADGTLKFVGAATVFEDLNFDPSSSGGPVATIPDYVTINNVFYREFTNLNNQMCGGANEVPHNYKLSSQLYPHMHIFLKSGESAGTTGVSFTFYWVLRPKNAAVVSGSVVLSATSAQLTANPVILSIYDSTGFTGSEVNGAQLNVAIYRTGGDAGDVVVTTYGVHYEIDTIGSRQITTK